MTTGASWLARALVRATCAIALLATATSLAPARADATPRHAARARGRTLDGRLISRRDGPLTVALGATHGDDHARALFARALFDAVARNPSLRLQPDGARGANLFLTANVRTLSVQHDPAGSLARCDVGLVIADASGAVRAVLDARRTVRTDASPGTLPTPDADEALATAALRSAMDGALRRLVESGQWTATLL